MKTCPYCAEAIQDAAVVCKHCGRDLKGDITGRRPVVRTREATSPLAYFGGILLVFLLVVWIVTLWTGPVTF